MPYTAAPNRYDTMEYRRCGHSGLKLPAISLGLWNNFGDAYSFPNAEAMLLRAFDLGINHFDLANNYGPPYGTAESTFGRVFHRHLRPYRDELTITTKAGYDMWPGPYGDWGSKKYLVASLDQSLRRMGLDYVDVFYHHRPDPETPVEETVEALEQIVRQGKALYVGVSNYGREQMERILPEFKRRGLHCLVNQYNYSMLNRDCEGGLLDTLREAGVGMCAYMPLYQGRLTDRYLQGIPEDSRAAGPSIYLNSDGVEEATIAKVRKLNALAGERGQTMAQMALAWVLRQDCVATTLIGASKPGQIEDCVGALRRLDFTAGELAAIDAILGE